MIWTVGGTERGFAAWAASALLALALAFALSTALRQIVTADLYPLADQCAVVVGVALGMLPAALGTIDRPLALGVGLAALTAGIAAVAIPLSNGATLSEPVPLLAGAAAVMVLTLFLGALARLLLGPAGDGAAATGWVLTLLIVVAASPLWLSGALDRGIPLADVLVTINPLTLLALPSGTDYPRADWLYRHSSLGSLRYDYPAPSSLIAAYGAIGLAGLLLPRGPTPAVRCAEARPSFTTNEEASV